MRRDFGKHSPKLRAVRLALERRREQRRLPPATVVTLPQHLQRRDVIVTPHALDSYDRLTEHRTDDHLAIDETLDDGPAA